MPKQRMCLTRSLWELTVKGEREKGKGLSLLFSPLCDHNGGRWMHKANRIGRGLTLPKSSKPTYLTSTLLPTPEREHIASSTPIQRV